MRRHLSLAGAVALALVVRLAALPRIYLADGVFPAGTDSYYHLRRAWLALRHGFSIPSRDPFCHFPDGVVDPWPPLHDLVVAALAWIAGGGEPDRELLMRTAVWLPPVLGTIAVVLLYALGRRLVGRTAALGAAWVYAACPAAAYQAQVGMADHHVAEALLALGIYTVVAREARGAAGSAVRAVVLGALLAAAILTWLGSVLFAGLAFVFLLWRAVRHAGSAEGRRTAVFAAAAFALAAGLVAPFALRAEFGRAGAFRSYHLSLLQPVLLLGLAGLVLPAHLLAAWIRRARRPRLRALLALGAAAAPALAIVVLTPLGAGLWEGAAFARRATPVLLLPLESRPLLFPRSGFSLEFAWLLFNTTGLAAAVGLWLLARRRPFRLEPTALLLLLLSTHAVLALFQVRFTHLLAADVALLAGLAVARFLAWGGRAGGGLLVGVALLVPGTVLGLRHFGPVPPPPAVRSALAALARTSPPVSQTAPEYGVVAVWDLGHWITWLGCRPSLDSPFLHLTPLVGTARFFLADSEEEADRVAAAYRIRFAVSVPIPVSPRGEEDGDLRYAYLYPRQFIQVLGRRESDYLQVTPAGLGITPAFARTLQFRLQYLDGVSPPAGRHPALPALDAEMFAAPTLRGWRLHAAADDPTFPGEGGRVKVFERVRGARLVGRLVPRAQIRVRATVRTPLGESYVFGYADRTTTDERGRFELRVPYWVRAADGEVGIDTAYEVQAAMVNWNARVKVDERAVREGREIDVR